MPRRSLLMKPNEDLLDTALDQSFPQATPSQSRFHQGRQNGIYEEH
jgi:hypothetical protein